MGSASQEVFIVPRAKSQKSWLLLHVGSSRTSHLLDDVKAHSVINIVPGLRTICDTI